MKDLQKWSALQYHFGVKRPKYHYKTIQDKHLKWSRLDIYKKTYKVLLKKYKLKYLKYSKNITLFIDSSNIYNKKGIESIGYGANPKKKESKISVICDKNENVYSLTLVDTIQKTGIKKTLPHDSKTINKSVSELLSNGVKYKKLYLVGDKGYCLNITDKKIMLNTNNIELVYPNRRNQKIKNVTKI